MTQAHIELGLFLYLLSHGQQCVYLYINQCGVCSHILIFSHPLPYRRWADPYRRSGPYRNRAIADYLRSNGYEEAYSVFKKEAELDMVRFYFIFFPRNNQFLLPVSIDMIISSSSRYSVSRMKS